MLRPAAAAAQRSEHPAGSQAHSPMRPAIWADAPDNSRSGLRVVEARCLDGEAGGAQDTAPPPGIRKSARAVHQTFHRRGLDAPSAASPAAQVGAAAVRQRSAAAPAAAAAAAAAAPGEGSTAEQGRLCGALVPPQGAVHPARGGFGGSRHALDHRKTSAAVAVTPPRRCGTNRTCIPRSASTSWGTLLHSSRKGNCFTTPDLGAFCACIRALITPRLAREYGRPVRLSCHITPPDSTCHDSDHHLAFPHRCPAATSCGLQHTF